MERALAGVPHHFGFCTSVIVWPDTDPILNGPPDRSMAGLTVEQLGFHPVFSITCAGTRLSKSICQSANVVLNFTVTVWPPLDPVTEAMSRYPAMLVTSVGRHDRVAPLLLPGVLEVGRRDRHAVGPDRLGVQGVDDGLGLGADQLGRHDQVRVRRRRTRVVRPTKGLGSTAAQHRQGARRVTRRRVGVAPGRALGHAEGDGCRPATPDIGHRRAAAAASPARRGRQRQRSDVPTSPRQRRGRRPRPVTAAGDPG